MTFSHQETAPRRPLSTHRRRVTAVAAGIGVALAVVLATSGFVPAHAEDESSLNTTATTSATDAPASTAPVSDDGANAVAQLARGELPAATTELIAATVPRDDDLTVADGILTALPSDGDGSIQSASLSTGDIITAKVAGMVDEEFAGDAVVGSTAGASSVMVQASPGGFQVVQVAQSEAASTLSLNFETPPGSNWVPEADGSLELRGADGNLKAVAQAPWAVDSEGKRLPTHYRVEGSVITQEVDLTGATFPVVSDPSVVWRVATAAACAAQIVSFVAVSAKLVAVFAKAEKIINASKAVVAAYKALGGTIPKAVAMIKKFAVNKSSLSAAQVSAVLKFTKAVGSAIFSALGIGSCYALLTA